MERGQETLRVVIAVLLFMVGVLLAAWWLDVHMGATWQAQPILGVSVSPIPPPKYI